MAAVINFLRESIDRYPGSFVFFILFFLGIITLWWVFQRRKKHKRALVESEGEKELDLIPLFHLENPTPKDGQALEIIEEYRKNIWYKSSLTPVMKSEEILHLSQDLVSDIARVYHPFISEPMYEASLVDLLEIIGRVNDKIRINTQEFPLSLIADRRISDILKMKDYYQTIKKNPALEFVMRNRTLFKTGKVLWSAYNTSNPWYWSRRLAYKATREAGLRYFYTLLVSEAGEEAIRVYSGRNIRTPEAGQELIVASEMVNMALVGGEISSDEYEEVLGYVLGSKKLDLHDKIDLLRSLVNKKRTRCLNAEVLDSEKVRRLLIRKVEAVAKRDKRFSEEKKKHLSDLEKKLAVQSELAGQLDIRERGVSDEELREQEAQVEQAILLYCIRMARCANKLDREKTGNWLHRFSRQCGKQMEISSRIDEESLKPAFSITPDISEYHKRKLLENILFVSLEDLPITGEEEDFFLETASEVDYFKSARDLHSKILIGMITPNKLISNPPYDYLRLLFRTIQGDEEIQALQPTSTRHDFREGDRVRQGYYWVLLTSERLILLASARILGRPYFYSRDFEKTVTVTRTPGNIYDDYLLKGGPKLENMLGGGRTLKQLFALTGNLQELEKNPKAE